MGISSTRGRYVKRMMHLLFSISVVSFLISISSLVCFGFETLRFCVTTLPVQLITHSINRNCIFLICNGLLVFIAKTSGLGLGAFVSSQNSTNSSLHSKPDEKTNIQVECEEEENNGKLEKSITSTPVVVDKEVVMVHGDDSSFKRWFFDKVKTEKSEDDEDIKELSMDEVNRRFDEFIWKMKEEIRLGASNQQQLNLYREI